jgi:hypothetical protein
MCVKLSAKEAAPPSTVFTWEDDESKFHLLPRDETLLATLGEGDTTVDRIKESGAGSSVWEIGSQGICKVKGWREDRQLEAATIAFINKTCPSVPLPEVLYSWTDKPSDRVFLILKRVQGRTLADAWPHLSAVQRKNIATEVAQHCSVMAGMTSLRFESVDGLGLLEYWLMGKPPASNPHWLPMILGPMSCVELKAYMARISSEPAPEFEEPLLFYHPDLGPTNVMVSDSGDKIAAIIDWESAGYYPKFWVATRPAASWAYRLEGTSTDAEKYEWRTLLVEALEMKEFSSAISVYTKWSKEKTGPA